jgi:hypothetical protein
MGQNGDRIWVMVEIVRGGQTAGFRGRMDVAAFDAILAGTFSLPFFRLDDVHWVDADWDAVRNRSARRLTRYGGDGLYRECQGAVYLRPNSIVGIAPLRDCGESLLEGDSNRDEDPLPNAEDAEPNPAGDAPPATLPIGRPSSASSRRDGIVRHELPAPATVLDWMRTDGDPLAKLAGMTIPTIVDVLASRWRFDGLPHLAHLANTILAKPLDSLSAQPASEKVALNRWQPSERHFRYWLSFDPEGYPTHVGGERTIEPIAYDLYPLRSVPGLEEFLRHFGGMVIGGLPPGAIFEMPTKTPMSNDDENNDWGDIAGWEGSLPIYTSCGGNVIVVRRDGAIGKWDHESGWGGEGPAISAIPFTFVELIHHLADHLVLPMHDPSHLESPFWY